jgi:hypothetical protein
MKKLWLLLLIAPVAGAYAQDSGFRAERLSKPLEIKQTEAVRPAPPMDGKPVPTGVIYQMSKDGLQVINPGAPASYGSGKQSVDEAVYPGQIPGTVPDDPKPHGGIKLFGWLF